LSVRAKDLFVGAKARVAYGFAAPTPPPAKSIVDQLVEKFGPKANAQIEAPVFPSVV